MGCKAPCSCHNAFTYNPAVSGVSCSSICTSERPCAYGIFGVCPLGTGDSHLFLHPITVAWMDCLFGETYSARRTCDGGIRDNGKFWTEGYVENAECAGMEYDIRPHNPHCYGEYIAEMLFGSDYYFGSCTGCTWPAGNTDPKVWEIVLQDFSISGGAIQHGPSIAYVNRALCDGTETRIAEYRVIESTGCHGATTMSKTASSNPPDEYYNYLPERICVFPYAANWTHPCGTGNSKICDCKDDGCPTILLPVNINCLNDIDEVLVLERNTTGCGIEAFGIDICPHIDWPVVDCGAFAWNVDATCNINEQKMFLFIVWCDGGAWNIRLYCITANNGTLDAVTLLDESTLTRISDCEEPYFSTYTFDASATDCCVCDCPSCDIPSGTYNYDITGPGNGSGTVAITGGGSSTFCIVKTLSSGDRMSIEIDLSDCSIRVGCNGTDCITYNCIASGSFSFASCDPLDITITITIGFLCSACARGTYTLHIYE